MPRDEWMTTEQVASEYQVPVKTVRAWRHRRVGPPAVKLGRHVRYSRRAVEEWARAQADPQPAA